MSDEKAQAKREREELLRRQASRRRLRMFGIIGLTAVVVGGSIVLGVVAATRPKPLPGIQTGPAPWSPAGALRERLNKIGLPVLGSEALAFHIHEHLDVFVHGRRVAVPADVGIDEQQGFLTVLHTHDASGIIHVESPVRRAFTLGQFFDVWGVRFTSLCLGGYCNDGDMRIRVYVDGTPVSGDPCAVPIRAHDEVVVTYGSPRELPKPIPSSFHFAAGL